MKSKKEDKDLVAQWAKLTYEGKSAGPEGIYEVNKFNFFLEYTQQTARQLIKEARLNLHTRETQIKILNFHKWLQEEKGKKPNAAFAYLKTVRSFYKFYNIPLAFRRGDLKKPPKKKIDYRLNLAQVKGMLHAASNLRARAILITLESTGLREGDVSQLLRSDIEPLLEKEAPIMVEVNTEKCNVPGYPFLHATAIKMLKEYLESRTDNFKWLFPTADGNPILVQEINRIVVDSFHNAGYKEGNYRIRGHCLRKFLIGRLQDAGIETNVWKLIVGKTAPEEAYSTTKLREAYSSALDKVDPETLLNNHAKVQSLEEEVRRLKEAYDALEKKKGYEAMLELFKKNQMDINREAFNNSKPVSLPKLNGVKGQPVTVRVDAPKINGGDVLTLKALVKTFQQLYDESKREKKSE